MNANYPPGYTDRGDICPICEERFFYSTAQDHGYCSQECQDLVDDNDIVYCETCEEEYLLPEETKSCPLCDEKVTPV